MSSLKDIEMTDDYVNNKYYGHDMCLDIYE